jgi:hypothetical protein
MGKRFNFIILAALVLCFYNGFIPTVYGQSLVFGPEFFSNNRGKYQRVIRSFSVEDVGQNFILSMQGGGSSEKRMGRGTVKINGEMIASLDLGKPFKILTKTVKLQKQNDISVDVPDGDGTSVVVTIMNLEEHAVTAKISPIGEVVDLAGYASIVFPASTFDSAQHVMIFATASTGDIFKAHATGPRLPYEVRINTGDKAPEKDIEVDLNIPDSFFPSPYQIHIFTRMHDNPDALEEHDRFFMISSSVDEVIMTVRTTLPKQAFSSRYGKNGTYEAVLIVGLIH